MANQVLPTPVSLDDFLKSSNDGTTPSSIEKQDTTLTTTPKPYLQSKNIHDDHITYSVDYTVLLAIGMVCITIIIVKFFSKIK